MCVFCLHVYLRTVCVRPAEGVGSPGAVVRLSVLRLKPWSSERTASSALNHEAISTGSYLYLSLKEGRRGGSSRKKGRRRQRGGERKVEVENKKKRERKRITPNSQPSSTLILYFPSAICPVPQI